MTSVACFSVSMSRSAPVGHGSASSSESESESDMADRNWGAHLRARAQVHTQTLSELTEDAVACKALSEPDVPSRASNPMTKLGSHSPWWARRIAAITNHHKFPALSRPLNVVSGCTGVSAESFVLEALELWKLESSLSST